jgi:hypothetical protein
VSGALGGLRAGAPRTTPLGPQRPGPERRSPRGGWRCGPPRAVQRARRCLLVASRSRPLRPPSLGAQPHPKIPSGPGLAPRRAPPLAPPCSPRPPSCASCAGPRGARPRRPRGGAARPPRARRARATPVGALAQASTGLSSRPSLPVSDPQLTQLPPAFPSTVAHIPAFHPPTQRTPDPHQKPPPTPPGAPAARRGAAQRVHPRPTAAPGRAPDPLRSGAAPAAFFPSPPPPGAAGRGRSHGWTACAAPRPHGPLPPRGAPGTAPIDKNTPRPPARNGARQGQTRACEQRAARRSAAARRAGPAARRGAPRRCPACGLVSSTPTPCPLL